MKQPQDTEETAVLVLGYNRPDLLEASLMRLRQAGRRNIWISIDGPDEKDSVKSKKQIRCVEIARSFQNAETRVRISERNLGCRDGVIAGLTWFFSRNEKGIVIEDDIEIENGYMKVMEELLEKYKEDKRIWSISSHCDPESQSSVTEDGALYLADLCRVWGWATWADRWMMHQQWLDESEHYGQVKCFLSLPRSVRSKDFALKIYACKKRHLHAWDYEWNISHLRNNGKSVTPAGLFSRNHGFRSDGTHTKGTKPPWQHTRKWNRQSLGEVAIPRTSKEQEKVLYANCGISQIKDWKIELALLLMYMVYNKLMAPVRIAKSQIWRL